MIGRVGSSAASSGFPLTRGDDGGDILVSLRGAAAGCRGSIRNMNMCVANPGTDAGAIAAAASRAA